jgi:hypothetical protein
LTDFVCLYNYEFWLSLCKIVRSSVILLLPLFHHRDAWYLHTDIIWSKLSTDIKELYHCSVWYHLKYRAFQYFDFERIIWKLFHKHIVREYRRDNNKWAIQRNWRNCCWIKAKTRFLLDKMSGESFYALYLILYN